MWLFLLASIELLTPVNLVLLNTDEDVALG